MSSRRKSTPARSQQAASTRPQQQVVAYTGKRNNNSRRYDDSSSDDDDDSDDDEYGAPQGAVYDSHGRRIYDSDSESDDDQYNPMVPEIPLNMAQMAEVEKYCRGNPIVMSAINFLINHLKANGITATMDLFGVKHKLSPALQKVFDIEWSGIFLEEFVWDAFLVGIIVTNLVPSNVLRGDLVPMCISRACFSATFIERFGRRREYRVYPLEAGINTKIYTKHRDPSTRVFNRENYNQELHRQSRRDRNVKVYVMFPPFSNGDINSPLSTLLEQITVHAWSFQNFGAADYNNAHPAWAVERQPRKPNETDVLGTTEIGENGIQIYQEEIRARVDKNETDLLQMHIKTAEALYQLQQADYAKATNTAKANPHAMVAPFAAPFTVPADHRIAQTERAGYNPHLNDLDMITTASVSRVIGIPAQLFSSDVAVHAANADLALQSFSKTILAYHKKILPILQDLYEASYQSSHRKYKQSIIRGFEGLGLKDSKVTQGKTKAAITGGSSGQHPHPTEGDQARYISSHGKPGNLDLSESLFGQSGAEQSEMALKIQVSKALGVNVSREPSFANPRPPIELSMEDVERLVDMGIHFQISFLNSTMASNIDTLVRLHQELSVLGYEAFIERLADVTGIDQACFLSREQHEQAIEQNAKQESELAEKYPNAEQQQKAAKEKAKGAGSGGKKASSGSKPKKPKAAASSSSASKK